MRRREFLGVLGGTAVALPLGARAQQAMPVVGFITISSAESQTVQLAGLHLGLKQAGFEVGQAIRMEYRYANNQADQLPTLATELVKILASVIVASGGPAVAFSVKEATAKIPVVFGPLPDPVRSGQVTSMKRPAGNITGIAALTIELDPKRLELLHELTATRGPIGVMVNPTRPDTQIQVDGIKAAARSVGRELVVVSANTAAQIDAAFATFAQRSIAGLMISADPFCCLKSFPTGFSRAVASPASGPAFPIRSGKSAFWWRAS